MRSGFCSSVCCQRFISCRSTSACGIISCICRSMTGCRSGRPLSCFYILWYFYVPGCMLWACFRAKDVFYQQVAALFSGAFVCAAVFVLYPTCVDFRPSAAGPGLARALCRLIYANDAPVNVFPSLHCYEALVMHLATFRVPPLCARRRLRLASAALVAFDLSVHAAGQTAFRGRSDRRMHAGCGDVSADGSYFRQKEGTP